MLISKPSKTNLCFEVSQIPRDHPLSSLSLSKSIFFSLVEQVSFCTSKVDDFGAAVPVLLEHSALFAVVGVGNSRSSTYDAFSFVSSVIALLADLYQSCRPHVGIADHALSLALFTEPSDENPGLLSAHDQIGVVLRHFFRNFTFSKPKNKLGK